ncbi:hypothetical protein Dimus_033659, partial [Dionaea muscipula]
TMKEVAEDTKTHFELMESKLKVIELDLNINFNLKIAKAEENLSQKINSNSQRLTNVEETLASLFNDQQEKNETNKPLTDFLISNFLGDAKKGENSGGTKEQRGGQHQYLSGSSKGGSKGFSDFEEQGSRIEKKSPAE